MRSHIVCAGGMIAALAVPGLAFGQKLELSREGPNLRPSLEVVTAEVEEEFDPKPPPVIPAKPLMRRPGLYTALGGAVVLAVAAALGAWSQAVASQIRDANGDGVIDVTRADAMGAQRNAVLANVVGALGVVGVGAGVGWMIFDSRDPNAAPPVGVSAHVEF